MAEVGELVQIVGHKETRHKEGRHTANNGGGGGERKKKKRNEEKRTTGIETFTSLPATELSNHHATKILVRGFRNEK